MKNKSNNIVFSILQEHPSVAGGLCTFAVAFTLVATNALYSQSGGHPLPLLATRDHVTTQSIQQPSVFKPQVRPVQTVKVKPKAIPTPTSRQNAQTAIVKPKPVLKVDPIVADIQQGLINSGDFSGAVDGKLGPVTKAAIMAYQTRNGFPADGIPSKVLLKVIELNEPRVVGIRKQNDNNNLVSNVSTATPKYNPRMVSKIQSGLVNFGEVQITVDGIYGKQTAAAISRFQQKYKLPVTGKPDENVLRALISKNAIPSG